MIAPGMIVLQGSVEAAPARREELATTHFFSGICVLCGHSYGVCKCTCTVCGAKKWQRTRHGWHHHVFCGGKRNGNTGHH